MRDLGRLVVADHRRQCGNEHQRAVDILLDLLCVRPSPFDQELAEIRAAVGHDRDRMRDVVDDQRFVDVHLEITAGAAETYGDVVRHHLHGDHRQSLGLSRIHLARHDRRTRLILGNHQFGRAGARSARHQSNVVADFIERDGKRPERTGELNQRVMRALHREFVRRTDEGQARQVRNFGGDCLGEAGCTRGQIAPVEPMALF
jgi:hypothetical protein